MILLSRNGEKVIPVQYDPGRALEDPKTSQPVGIITTKGTKLLFLSQDSDSVFRRNSEFSDIAQRRVGGDCRA